jgi:lysophospholipase L1-like esterase
MWKRADEGIGAGRIVVGRFARVRIDRRRLKAHALTVTVFCALGVLFVLACIVPLDARTLAAGGFYLHDGDRVVFYGDSITERGFYTSFVEDYVATRFPTWNITFINSGWGGDWIEGGGGGKAGQRIARDILANHPTVVTMMLGMNDGGYQPYDQAFFDAYEKGYRQFVNQLIDQHPPLRVTLIEPSPYDDVTRAPQFGKYNDVMIRYGQFVNHLAHEKGFESVDFNAPLLHLLQAALHIDPESARKLIPDEIHPASAASLLLGAVLIKSWGGPSQISSVTLDAASAKPARAENAVVTDLKLGSTMSWSETDSALPLPVAIEDPEVALVLRTSDTIQEIDHEMLQVKGLTAASYTLQIDGVPVGVWSSEQLAGGVNLALVSTPMLKQALAVHALTKRLLALRIARWQNLQVALQDEKSKHVEEAMNSLDALQTELLAERCAAAQPRMHAFALTPVATAAAGASR